MAAAGALAVVLVGCSSPSGYPPSASTSSTVNAARDDCTRRPPTEAKQTASDGLLTRLPAARPIRPLSAYPEIATLMESEGAGWMDRSGTKVLRAGPFHVVGDVADRRLTRVASDLRHGVPLAARFTGNSFVDTVPVLVFAPRKHRDYARLVGEDFASTDGTAWGAGGAPMMALNPYLYTESTVWSRALTTHELVHVVGPLNDDLPFWLTEGYAEMGTELSDPEMRDVNDDLAFEDDQPLPEVIPEEIDEIDFAYSSSASFVRYLCGLKGRVTLVDLYETALAVPENLDAEVKTRYGRGLPALERRWRATLESSAPGPS